MGVAVGAGVCSGVGVVARGVEGWSCVGWLRGRNAEDRPLTPLCGAAESERDLQTTRALDIELSQFPDVWDQLLCRPVSGPATAETNLLCSRRRFEYWAQTASLRRPPRTVSGQHGLAAYQSLTSYYELNEPIRQDATSALYTELRNARHGVVTP